MLVFDEMASSDQPANDAGFEMLMMSKRTVPFDTFIKGVDPLPTDMLEYWRFKRISLIKRRDRRMRRFISKKSLGFIASLMIMTVAFAVPVLAGTVDLTEKGSGNKIGEIRFYDEDVRVPFCANIGEQSYTFNLRVNITRAEWNESRQMIEISGTYSEFNPSEWRDLLLKTSTPQPGETNKWFDNYLIHSYHGSRDMGVVGGKITSLNTSSIPSSYVGTSYSYNLDAGSLQILARNGENFPVNSDGYGIVWTSDSNEEEGGHWFYRDNNDQDHNCTIADVALADTASGRISGALSLVFKKSEEKKEEKKEEKHEEEEAPQPKKSEWRPAPEAAKTPAQTAAAQLTTAQTNLAALSVIPAASKEVFKSSGMPLNMTSVNTVDSNTTKLISANSDIPYNVTFMFLGKPMVCTIPAGFNYAQFTKADGTMNIHEVLWSVYTGSWKKTNTRARTTRARAR